MFPLNQVLNVHRMLETGQYQISSSRGSEDIWLAAYLFQNGYSFEEAEAVWIPIYETRYPKEKKETYDNMFDLYWRKGTKYTLKTQRPITIYQEEIDVINAADLNMRCKEFALVLLAYAKSQGFRRIVSQNGNAHKREEDFSKRIGTIIRRFVKSGGKHGEKNEWFLCTEAGLLKYTATFPKNRAGEDLKPRVYYDILYIANGGTVAYNFDTICDIQQAFESLKCELICKQCGKRFEKKPHTQRDICEECWKKQKRNKLDSFLCQRGEK